MKKHLLLVFCTFFISIQAMENQPTIDSQPTDEQRGNIGDTPPSAKLSRPGWPKNLVCVDDPDGYDRFTKVKYHEKIFYYLYSQRTNSKSNLLASVKQQSTMPNIHQNTLNMLIKFANKYEEITFIVANHEQKFLVPVAKLPTISESEAPEFLKSESSDNQQSVIIQQYRPNFFFQVWGGNKAWAKDETKKFPTFVYVQKNKRLDTQDKVVKSNDVSDAALEKFIAEQLK